MWKLWEGCYSFQSRPQTFRKPDTFGDRNILALSTIFRDVIWNLYPRLQIVIIYKSRHAIERLVCNLGSP